MALELLLEGALNMEDRDDSGLSRGWCELGPASESCDAARGIKKAAETGRDDVWNARSDSSTEGGRGAVC